MLLQTQPQAIKPKKTYAEIKNERFSNTQSHYVEADQRWKDTLATLPTDTTDSIQYKLQCELTEFNRKYPNITSWADIEQYLPEAQSAPMSNILVDITMQRFLSHWWSCTIVGKFNPLKVAPIQVYKPDPNKDEYVAWDGQHTLVALWLICKYILKVKDFSKIKVPVVIYKSTQKADMRDSFVGHNGGEYKTLLDLYDIIEQMIFGVRVDNSKNPAWIKIEEKQQIVEKYGFFLTKATLGDGHMPGAITRMQEFEKLDVNMLESLCKYLVAVGANKRPVEEKEMVLMSYFFTKAHHNPNVQITDQFINDIAQVHLKHFDADFTPEGPFWSKATEAYYNWHNHFIQGISPKFSKEAIHGYPFLIAQLNKDLPGHRFPQGTTNSPFIPMSQDLF
jgi:hypothetical protein